MRDRRSSNTVAAPGIELRVQAGWPRQVWAFCRARPLGAVGAAMLALVVLAAVLAPVVTSRGPLLADDAHRLEGPSRSFPFGTDIFGRDQFSRVIYGARTSLYVGLISVIGSTIIGTLLGITSAYMGRWTDLAVQRLVDALQGIPSLVLALALVVALGPSLNNVTIAIGASYIARMTRLSRAQALTVKEQDYVLAAQVVGASHWRIILRHVAVNSLTPSIVVGTALLGSAIVAEAGLSFLGLGVPPPHPSWGGMLQFGARGYMESAPWLVTFPGLALTITVFGFNLFGDALRDSFDPRLRGH